MLKVALTHDIDRTKKTYQHITKTLRALLKLDLEKLKNQIISILKRDNYWTFDEIIKIEESYNVKSTYFFLNETIPFKLFKLKTYKLALGRYKILDKKIVDLIKQLDKNGFEIGVHGSYNSYKSLELLKFEKKTLENILGHEVIGIRQHYLNLDENTWQKQKEVGFKYDSSIGYSGSLAKIGFVDERILPFNPFNDEFTVIPLVIMDANFMMIKNRWEEFTKLLNFCNDNNTYLVVNFHNHVYNELEFPGYKNAYKQIIEECLRLNAEFLTMKEIHKLENAGSDKMDTNKINIYA
ncbi:MAG: polysaccharide deacetylase family protein [Crocinitomicaceae bacterium]|nr:polysaccharide deacetylase family protein [Crocinitomicaceae bacterium]